MKVYATPPQNGEGILLKKSAPAWGGGGEWKIFFFEFVYNIKKHFIFASSNNKSGAKRYIGSTKKMEQTIKTISIEILAEKLNGKLWIKGDLKRIYLDRGYNTKKMSTKTYVYQTDEGDYKVSCQVDCPSQPWQWCKSQEDEIKKEVSEQIDNVIAISKLKLIDYKLLTEGKSAGEVMVYVQQSENEPTWFTEDIFYTNFSKYPQDIWEEVDELLRPERERMAAERKEKIAQEIVAADKFEAEKTAAMFDAGGTKYSHDKFGVGSVVYEDEQTITLTFESVGEKKLLKRFAKLTKMD